MCSKKEIQVDEELIKSYIIKKQSYVNNSLLTSIKDFANDKLEPYQKLCDILIDENIASICKNYCVHLTE